MSNKTLSTIIVVILFLGLGAGLYYFYFFKKDAVTTTTGVDNNNPTGFSPFGKSTDTPTNNTPVKTPDNATNTPTNQGGVTEIPKLRQLSSIPVAGMSASSTKNSSVLRYIERGAGYIYESNSGSNDINKLSNTTLPKIYQGYWNKNLNAFIARYLKGDTDTIVNFYGEMRSTGSSTSETPYEVKGKFLSPEINQIAVSPYSDKIFTWNIESGKGIGYISNFDEKNKVKIADTPITQAIIDWPETNTVSLTTKGSALSSGYEYTINTKTGAMNKVVGPIKGLSAKISSDLNKIIYSSGGTNTIKTSLLNKKDGSLQEVIFKTLADKCIWSKLRKNEVYCAVPTEIPNAVYPDDWYKGSVSFIDQIWHLDTSTGEVHLLANLINLSNNLIDATQLTLDPKENYLYFINKRDLTLWSLDLNR